MDIEDLPHWRLDMLRSFYLKAEWKLRFAWLPHRCMITNRRVWLEFAYCGTAMWTGPGDPVYETQWHNKQEHLIWALKGNK